MDSVRLAKVTASNNGSRGVGPFAVDQPEDLDVALRSHTRPRATFSTASTLRLTTLTLLTESLHRSELAQWPSTADRRTIESSQKRVMFAAGGFGLRRTLALYSSTTFNAGPITHSYTAPML